MRFLLSLLARLPLSARIVLGRFLGRIFALIPTRDRKIAELQMRVFLGERYSAKMLREMYASFGQTLLESLNLHPILADIDRYVTCPDWGLAEEVFATGRPVVTLTGHYGNWDLLAAYCIKRGIRLCTIGKEIKSAKWHKFIDDLRSSYGIETIWRADADGIKTILNNLKSGKVVAALIDQDTEVSSSFVPFFGVPVRCPSGLVVIGKRMNAVISAAFVTRTGRGRYQVNFHRLDDTKSLDEILTEYHSILESYVRRHPEQWAWIHKRWRSLPGGERLSSRDYVNHLEKQLQHGI